MKKILDAILGLAFFAFTIWLWIGDKNSFDGKLDSFKILNLGPTFILLVSFLLIFSIYIRFSTTLILNMCTMFLSLLLWSTSLRSMVHTTLTTGKIYTNILGFIVMLIAFGQSFHRKLKNS